METVQEAIARILPVLDECEVAKYKANGWNNIQPDAWHSKERKKFIALDCGSSGAFLIEKKTGEIYNIQGYGRPDHNKKRKADIGNILTVDPKVLWSKRWNYLR